MNLKDLAAQGQNWGLEEFVTIANTLIPSYVVAETADSRVKQTLSERLVRSYTGIGLLDEPLREGRNARYTYRHLLQVLVVRRLLSDGMSTGSIGERVSKLANGELEGLLQGGIQMELSVANPALNFLRELQNRRLPQTPLRKTVMPTPPVSGTVIGSATGSSSGQSPPLNTWPAPGTWQRFMMTDGIEIHIRDDAILPRTGHELEGLMTRIEQCILEVRHERSKRRGKYGSMQR